MLFVACLLDKKYDSYKEGYKKDEVKKREKLLEKKIDYVIFFNLIGSQIILGVCIFGWAYLWVFGKLELIMIFHIPITQILLIFIYIGLGMMFLGLILYCIFYIKSEEKWRQLEKNKSNQKTD